MVCKYCGKEVNNDSKFCASCGTPIAEATPANYMQNPTPMPMQSQSVGAVPPAMPPAAGNAKKNGKAGLIVLIVILVLLLAGGGALAFIFLNRPIGKINKALEADDIETVVELYGELSGDKDKEEVSEKLLAYAEEVRDRYFDEKIDYDAAIQTLNLLTSASLETNDEIEDIRVFVNRIYASREAFASAEKYRSDGEYALALEEYANVIGEDSHYYDMAQDAIEETEKELEDTIAEAGKALIGTWALEYDLADALSDELGSDYADFHAPLPITLLFDFNEDGTYRMYADEDAFIEAFDQWGDAFVDYSLGQIYDMFEKEYGLSRAETDAYVLEFLGMSMQDYILLMVSDINMSSILREAESTGTYETRYDRLYLSDGYSSIDEDDYYEIFTVNGNKLILELAEGASSSQAEILPGLSYPLELEKDN